MKFNQIYILITAIFLSSCTTSSVLVSIQQPADITIPQEIKNVVVANRSFQQRKILLAILLKG